MDDIKNKFYCEGGTLERDCIEDELATLRVGIQIRETREKRAMKQCWLAESIGKKRTFISKVENDGGNINLKTSSTLWSRA